MGKGDHYRPTDREKYNKSYDRIFRGVKPEIPIATQVECTAIVKYVLPDNTEGVDE